MGNNCSTDKNVQSRENIHEMPQHKAGPSVLDEHDRSHKSNKSGRQKISTKTATTSLPESGLGKGTNSLDSIRDADSRNEAVVVVGKGIVSQNNLRKANNGIVSQPELDHDEEAIFGMIKDSKHSIAARRRSSVETNISGGLGGTLASTQLQDKTIPHDQVADDEPSPKSSHQLKQPPGKCSQKAVTSERKESSEVGAEIVTNTSSATATEMVLDPVEAAELRAKLSEAYEAQRQAEKAQRRLITRLQVAKSKEAKLEGELAQLREDFQYSRKLLTEEIEHLCNLMQSRAKCEEGGDSQGIGETSSERSIRAGEA